MDNENQQDPTHFDQLSKILDKSSEKHRRKSNFKQVLFWTLQISAYISGGVVVANVSTNWFGANSLSLLTIFSGVCLASLRSGKLQERARWNKSKQRKMDALRRRLVYEKTDVAKISAELTLANEELDKERANFEFREEDLFFTPSKLDTLKTKDDTRTS